MCSESMPKEFKKTTEVLPFTKCGLTSMQEFKEAESHIHDLLWLKNAGLTYEEINLYQANERGLLDQQKKVEANAMKEKLEAIYSKLRNHRESSREDGKPGASKVNYRDTFKAYQQPLSIYPEGHPMNSIKEIEVDLFGHLHSDDIPPISKRRKMLRRFERKKNRVLAYERQVSIASCGLAIPTLNGERHRRRRLWDMEIEQPLQDPFQYDYILNEDRTPRNWHEHCLAPRNRNDYHPGQRSFNEHPDSWRNRPVQHRLINRKKPIGPRNKQVYSIRDKKIVKVQHNNQDQGVGDNVDNMVPENPIEDQLLEGTKMSIDDIRKIERFKDYNPGVPSKGLYLKNIAPTVNQEQVSLLFNQFVLANGGPISVRLMTAGRMRGQAFIEFQEEDICIQALSEANGTILSGQPIIAQFTRTNNRPRLDDNR